MDHLAIAVHELASISERRIERLVHPGKYNINTVDNLNFDYYIRLHS